MNWYLKVLKQYADFRGRARRKEYWMFTLVNTIIIFVLALIMVFGTFSDGGRGGASTIGMILYYGYALAVFIPSLAVCVRRLHDVGKSGWYYFIGLIPLIGVIMLLIWFCTDGQAGENEWGANPKEDCTTNNYFED